MHAMFLKRFYVSQICVSWFLNLKSLLFLLDIQCFRHVDFTWIKNQERLDLLFCSIKSWEYGETMATFCRRVAEKALTEILVNLPLQYNLLYERPFSNLLFYIIFLKLFWWSAFLRIFWLQAQLHMKLFTLASWMYGSINCN